MDDKKFEELISRYVAGRCTAAEERLIEEWLNKRSKSNLYGSLSNDDKASVKENIIKRLESQMPQARNVKQNNLSFPWNWMGRAAVIAILSAFLYAALYNTRQKESEPVAMLSLSSDGNIRKVILPDSSIVWLKGNSTIDYPAVFNGQTRNVALQGEALFEVAKDALHPFIIKTGDLTTTVLGTSFNIKTINKSVEVVVLTGSVSLTSVADVQEIVVLPNEKGIYHVEEKHLSKLETTVQEKTTVVSNTQYNMEFIRTPIEEIAARIEKKFNVRVVLESPSLATCRITANLTDQNLNHTLSLIAQSLGIAYEIENDVVLLRGVGCDNTMPK
jgi:transmembrane sensor